MHQLALQRKDQQKENNRLTAALRNESRKRQRIIKKSMHLSNEDLADVLTLRKCKEEKAESVSQAQATGVHVEPKHKTKAWRPRHLHSGATVTSRYAAGATREIRLKISQWRCVACT